MLPRSQHIPSVLCDIKTRGSPLTAPPAERSVDSFLWTTIRQWRILQMLIIETLIFTKRVLQILGDDEYRELQIFLSGHPEAGSLIPGTRGLRKLHWSIPGKGKRGGSRVIHYWLKRRDIILMLFLFRKNERSDLTKDQLRILMKVVERELL
jgi:hypothetical protein